MTTVGSGVTVGSSSPAAVRSPLYIVRCGARSNRRSQATIRSPLLKAFLVVTSCDVTSAKLTIESDCASVSGQAQIRPCNTSTSSRCHGGTPVRSRCVGRCAQRAHHREHQQHRRSEWAGVSWPKDDRDEGDPADGTGFARKRGSPNEPTTPQTFHSARSSVPWRGKPHASALSWS